MVYAFVMAKTEAGSSEAVLEEILAMDAVVDAHVVAGEWDVIAEVDAGEVQDVLGASSSGIQALENVVDTKTYISMSA
ncbi:Lrp/AsnC ligand binding domain-containing protein [Halarchaeum sp. P4]|uniref:Lrp/AsnC ligand binding domain-containing protein n=1 Tax=Halarchaeum sp. P4 TaxID=3421639 RepID=UPI003EB7D9BB